MKNNKILYLALILAFAFAVSAVCAARFEIVVPVDSPQILNGLQTDYEVVSYPQIKNTSDQAINFKISLIPVSVSEGQCFGVCAEDLCFPPAEGYYETPYSYTLEPGETSAYKFMYISLYPSGYAGNTEITVRFFNENDTNDFVAYNVDYRVGSTNVKEAKPIAINPGDLLPNPASDHIVIKNIGSGNIAGGTLKIFNLAGNVIEKISLKNVPEDYSVNTSAYPEGIYFIKIIKNNKNAMTGRFIISR